MFSVLAYAFADSINVLLIGVIVSIGVMLPRSPSRYRAIATLLVAGDWTGVFLLSVVTLAIFDQMKQWVSTIVESPLFGIVLIATGLLVGLMTWRSGGADQSSAVLSRMMGPVRIPSYRTFLAGMTLGAIQSVTSVPFFGGLIVLAAGDFSFLVRYSTLFLYASVALSLPTLAAFAVGWVRTRPDSAMGRVFDTLRSHPDRTARVAGYVVSVLLAALGASHLL